jgi:glyoxylase-like metal-dependent hydrolase (beta-lactamase superfamily II)
MKNVPPNLYAIRGMMGCCFLLADGGQSVLLDTGLFGEHFLVRRLVRKLGLQPQSIKTIWLTHGHLDHAGNVAWLQQWTGAKVWAHPEEQAHINGTYPYQGVSRWCGRLEAAGRAVFRYRPVLIDEFSHDGQELPLWGGLRVIHLPGHTKGHCGFYSQKYNLLFSGDMFASYTIHVHKPPPILNSVPEFFGASAEKIRQLQPRWMIPNHFDILNGGLHRQRFCRVYGLADWIDHD